ncbi:glycosyltransferase [Phocaeicola coprocola]|jgi:glycosyltransferase involved in cell wall biosynthesis|uniref:glycosyltransferase n=1 Tax=Phocaeicola coprocola TaxID=310298 RepID=UPI00266F79FB|nr:glycosyltransferase [Phocaeicola coprocola]
MKKRIFIAIQYLEIGGAERALIGLLSSLDYTKYEVDLFVYRHSGEFMKFIPDEVNLLPEIKKYTTLSRPIKELVKEGYIDIAIGRVLAHLKNKIFNKRHQTKDSIAIYQYVASYTTPFMPSFYKRGEYDLAISFLIPHNIVREKVLAKQYWAWIHTDYSYVDIDVNYELPVWSAYNKIISISEDVTKGFLSKFPALAPKITIIENILSENFVKEQAEEKVDLSFLPSDSIKFCTVARFSYPKAIDRAVYICKELIDKGLNIYWYIIGYGSDETMIREKIKETQMEKRFVLIGKKENPYPYIKATDFYIQPSRYEGKAVTVREAQILEKPVVITNYPTAKSQLNDGIDGVIVPDSIEGATDGIEAFLKDKDKQNRIIAYLKAHHYGNEFETKKIDKLLNE